MAKSNYWVKDKGTALSDTSAYTELLKLKAKLRLTDEEQMLLTFKNPIKSNNLKNCNLQIENKTFYFADIETMYLIAEGYNCQSIADKLNITYFSARRRIHTVYKILGVCKSVKSRDAVTSFYHKHKKKFESFIASVNEAKVYFKN